MNDNEIYVKLGEKNCFQMAFAIKYSRVISDECIIVQINIITLTTFVTCNVFVFPEFPFKVEYALF